MYRPFLLIDTELRRAVRLCHRDGGHVLIAEVPIGFRAITCAQRPVKPALRHCAQLVDGVNTVAEYEYDASNRRIVKSVYSGGSLDHRQHFYYSAGWQVLEVRKEVGGSEDGDPLEQYVWHAGFIDALVLRDYDADTNGTDTNGTAVRRHRWHFRMGWPSA